ncbi:hypothetical protein BJ875DRAFT_484001 [Amylocarpus encephaloides]|uniref:Uncharacterized protein n=1 Tax=Amylocarpus encephaloides TaxID=45428 RepID=A0A9P7YK84_9HELO|nr:hypothetical protein BJ875DRAFT_484001 [Amylocarpus encephaloides]
MKRPSDPETGINEIVDITDSDRNVIERRTSRRLRKYPEAPAYLQDNGENQWIASGLWLRTTKRLMSHPDSKVEMLLARGKVDECLKCLKECFQPEKKGKGNKHFLQVPAVEKSVWLRQKDVVGMARGLDMLLLRCCCLILKGNPSSGFASARSAYKIAEKGQISYMMAKCRIYWGICSGLERKWKLALDAFGEEGGISVVGWEKTAGELRRWAERNKSRDDKGLRRLLSTFEWEADV